MAESIFWPVSSVSLRPIWASRPFTTSFRFLSRSDFSISFRFDTAEGIRAEAAEAAPDFFTAFLTVFFAARLTTFFTVFFFAAVRAEARAFFAGLLALVFAGF